MARAEISTRKLLLILVLPAVLIILFVILAPILFSFVVSLNKATPRLGGIDLHWRGLVNYYNFFFKSPQFWLSIRITLYFTIVSLIIELILGTGISLVLNRKFFARSLVRALILIPWAVPTVVNARLWEWIYAGNNFGALNGFLKVLGILAKDHNVVWLGFDTPFTNVPLLGSLFNWMGVSRALNMIIIADTWKVTPLVVFLLLAGLQQIPKSLYEVGSIDGANSWRKFWSITYPYLKPVYLVILVLRTMELFRVFDIIYILMQYSIRVVGVYTYEIGMKFLKFGQGSALSFLVALFILAFTLIYIKIFYREEV
ncbi:MAG: sugar ABC transporter permease [Spirochaetales bacterium]|nr:sugar ABC transporter permease [Spirochaetales bacterium]